MGLLPRALFLLPTLLLAACVAPETTTPGEEPYVLVLGTAQDGGFPQIGSDHPRARRARAEPGRRRLVASLLIVDPRSGQRWLIDATPDIREQVQRAEGHPARRAVSEGRPPLFEGIFLTHAHIGHYAGLVHLGREAYGARRMPLFCSQEMAEFLESNAPWDLLVRLENVVLHPIQPDIPLALSEDLSITPFLVPHRAEYTDTFGFRIEGPHRSLIYIPDIDKWELWERSIESELAKVDIALLDGTFFANGEIPGRDMSEIPHPFIEESLARFAPLPASERAKVRFTHLNHTNPATDPEGEAQRQIETAGMSVAAEAEIIIL